VDRDITSFLCLFSIGVGDGGGEEAGGGARPPTKKIRENIFRAIIM